MNITLALKAIADETRMELLTMLLKNSCCVRALARRLGITDATVSQHLKVLREAGFLSFEKSGRFTHYHVNRDTLQELADALGTLTKFERSVCMPDKRGCQSPGWDTCHPENSKCGCQYAGI